MVPTPIYDNDTVPTPFVTMVELVFGCEDFDDDDGEPTGIVCQVCADRGTTHVPGDDFETYSRED